MAISAEADIVAPLTASRIEQARDSSTPPPLRDAAVKTLDRLGPEPGPRSSSPMAPTDTAR